MTAFRQLRKADPDRTNPFVPGQGRIPPYLAGRETEQRLIKNLLDRLVKGWAPGRDVVLFGPRGNGKTVLMEWSLREAQSRKIGTGDFYGGEFRSRDELIGGLSVASGWSRLFSSVSWLGVGIRTRDVTSGRLSDVLARRTRQRPLVIAIDEAHVLGIELGQALINAVQGLRRKGSPILLMLVGTPDLPRRLNSMGASFWDRSAKLRIGRLSPEAAAEAIRIPLEERDYMIASDALDQVVPESEAYPFFVQLWGGLLWDTLQVSSSLISAANADQARGQFEDERDEYYLNRYEELRRAGLARVAASVSSVYLGADKASADQVEGAVRSALESMGQHSDKRSVTAALEQLHELGYIWAVSKQSRHYFEPGIPSLMQFVARSDDSVAGLQPS
ncbi:MAG: ATP-binding protein [Bryobacterales bacterium]|nr:ATP-binding protein [Bryobacterales bacterium]